jgi:hypothetical protein
MKILPFSLNWFLKKINYFFWQKMALLLVVHVTSALLMAVHGSPSDLGPDYDWSPSQIVTNAPDTDPDLGLVPTVEIRDNETIHVYYAVQTEATFDNSLQKQEHADFQTPDPIAANPQIYYGPQASYQTAPVQQNYPVQESSQPSYDFNYYQPENKYSSVSSNSPSYGNSIVTHPKPSKQKLSDKTWNVPAPYIKPANNLIEDVSFNIGIILVAFTIFVMSLGAIAAALTTKRTGRSVSVDDHREDLISSVFKGFQWMDDQFKNEIR